MKKPYLIPLSILLVFLTSLACSLPFSAPERATPLPTLEETTSPATGTPPPATPTTVETPDIIDPCLLGQWTMDVVALNNKFLDLVPTANMYVVAPSSMVMEFRSDTSVFMNGEMTLHFDIPNTSDYFEMIAFHEGEGAYGADGTVLTYVGIDYNVEYGTMRSYINGESAEIQPTAAPLPENPMGPPSYANYRCSDRSLQITYDGPTGPITEEWIR